MRIGPYNQTVVLSSTPYCNSLLFKIVFIAPGFTKSLERRMHYMRCVGIINTITINSDGWIFENDEYNIV